MKWLTNLGHKDAKDNAHLLTDAFHIGTPKATEAHSEVELIGMGMAGLYQVKEFTIEDSKSYARFNEAMDRNQYRTPVYNWKDW